MSKLTTFLSSVAAVVALSVSMTSTAAAAVWTLTTTGTISEGYDVTGVFGTVDTDLAGMSFVNSITVDPTAYSNLHTFGDLEIDNSGTLTGTATTTVTVGNVTRTFAWDLSQTNYGWSSVATYNSSGANTGGLDDAVGQGQWGYTADGSELAFSGDLYSNDNAFGLGTTFNQNWTRIVQRGDIGESFFSIYSNSDDAYFYGTPSTISIAPVPEPETYAMLLAGLGLLSFTAKRRKQRA